MGRPKKVKLEDVYETAHEATKAKKDKVSGKSLNVFGMVKASKHETGQCKED